jgi:Ca2+-binding EF-hand superfamily protein
VNTATKLAPVLSLILGGAVLAAPDAPAPRAVNREPAPAPRAKFTAPKLNSSFDVLVFATQRPVRIRVTALHDGKPLDELWRQKIRTAFDYFDRDGDGFLDANELRLVFTEQGMAQLLAGGLYQVGAANAPSLARLDKDGDGKVSFEEYVASFTQLIRAMPVQFDTGNSAMVTEALFKLLDANGDGKLTRDEVRAAEKMLATLDADEDECLSAQELLPNLYQNLGRGRLVTQPVAPGPAYPGAAGSQLVVVYETGRVPGTVTQQVIKRYDKDGDFELTKEECGFDDETFRALDRDQNGKLDGEELDAWRTGAPDLEVTLSLASKPADCAAQVKDEQSAAARGFKLKQNEKGRVVLHVGKQPIDFLAVPQPNQLVFPPLKQQYAYLFQQAAGGKAFVLEKDLNGPAAVQSQFVRVMFEAADRNADGKLTKEEFDAYFDLQDGFRNVGLSLAPSVQTPSLFQLLDENRDGRLSVRELRTAWDRLIVLEGSGAEVVTKAVIQPTVMLRLSRTFDRNNNLLIAQPQFMGGDPNRVPVPQRGPMWFRKMDRNGDGDVSRTEFLGTKAEFEAIDTDGDGLISLDEAEAWDKKMRAKEAPAPDEKPADKPKPNGR